MIPAFVSLTAVCVGMGAADVREFEKLLRANHPMPTTARAQVMGDSPRCRRIAAAAGYAGRRLSVLTMGNLYAVVFADELRVLDRELKPLRANTLGQRNSSGPSNVSLQLTGAESRK